MISATRTFQLCVWEVSSKNIISFLAKSSYVRPREDSFEPKGGGRGNVLSAILLPCLKRAMFFRQKFSLRIRNYKKEHLANRLPFFLGVLKKDFLLLEEFSRSRIYKRIPPRMRSDFFGRHSKVAVSGKFSCVLSYSRKELLTLTCTPDTLKLLAGGTRSNT